MGFKSAYLDIDGTCFDTVGENYLRLLEAWPVYKGAKLPISLEQLRSVRHKVGLAVDYFPIIDELANSATLPTGEAIINFRSSPEGTRAHEVFYGTRKNAIKTDKDSWLESQRCFDGIPEMFRDLDGAGIKLFVVTSKDKNSVLELCDFHKLSKYISGVYDNSIKGGRQTQFAHMQQQGFDHSSSFSYDDMSENLEIARDFGITPIGASQGYDKPENLRNFKTAYPKDVIKIVTNSGVKK
jgi:phosphoglycolate phosphatase-like HAD superfamily hydrolase